MKLKEQKITLRAMLKDDLDAVNAIEQSTHEFPCTRGIRHDCIEVGYLCVVIEVDAKIVGYAICRLDQETELFNITIQTKDQGKGFGRQMLEHLIDFARQRGCKKFLLEVRISNEPAIKLYKRLSFIQVDERKDYYELKDGTEDALVFEGRKLKSWILS